MPGEGAPNTVNGMFWGVLISTALFGINIVQGWIYINTNEDKWPLRLFVTLLFGIDIALTAICSKIAHYYFIKNFGNPIVLVDLDATLNAEFGLIIVIVFLVQVYFVGRVYMLHRDRVWISVVIAMGTVGTFVCGIISMNDIAKGKGDIRTLVSTQMRIALGVDHALATLTDIFTTIALSWTFSTTRTTFKRTRALLQKLLLYTVTRGLFVTIIQLAFLVTYQAQPFGASWVVLHFCLGKVYMVTMITMLNSRASLRLEFDDPLEITPSAFVESGLANRSKIRFAGLQDISVVKTDTRTTDKDKFTTGSRKSNEPYGMKNSHYIGEEVAASCVSRG
ncbi:hypothetical protein BDZ94DRAFT_1269276 [Collybia nuda]|uniref:DUF6534 domain-containing protein n=1 Tax=Collybia nuda TaxID=64659 RepID=A0A9P5XYA0_9AGAR|nr:hypothetical protein BDZ94DRAFT_1269276 [Collybia nuda]